MSSNLRKKLAVAGLVLAVAIAALATLKVRAQQDDPQRPGPALKSVRGVENAAALDKFFRSLASVKRRIEPVRVMHFGDSHTAADILTAEIRKSFQRDFG